MMKDNKTGSRQNSLSDTDFFTHIKDVSDKVKNWPGWKQGEFVNVFEKSCGREHQDQKNKPSK